MRMKRRDFLKGAAAAGLGSYGLNGMEAAKGASPERQNIVLIMADDLGYECIGANGGTSYKTPEIDKLAGEGVRFEHCYSQPLCTPSRVKLMTGISNVRNYVRFGLLDPGQTTFAHLFKKAGYKTCIVGKWQLEGGFEGPGHFGFDEYCLWQLTRRPGRYPNPGLEINGQKVNYEDGQYGPDVVSDYACDFIRRNKGRPFLVYYPMIITHCPFEPTPDSPDYDPKSKGSKTYKGNPKYFGDMVEYMDKIVGKIVRQLDELGLRENTLVLFTGDNGTDAPVVSMMGDTKIKAGKGKMTDAGTRVPLVASQPGTVERGRVCQDIVDLSDFMPTICESAGISVPDELDIDGHSFWPQLVGKKGNPRDWIYIWYARDGKLPAQEFARNQRYKLYRTGEFYNVAEDRLEKNALKAGQLNAAEKKVRQMLQKALDRYEDARPEKLRRLRNKKKR